MEVRPTFGTYTDRLYPKIHWGLAESVCFWGVNVASLPCHAVGNAMGVMEFENWLSRPVGSTPSWLPSSPIGFRFRLRNRVSVVGPCANFDSRVRRTVRLALHLRQTICRESSLLCDGTEETRCW